MVGSADAIAEASLWRRRYGGAMRQAGVIAAAGMVAMDHMVDRLVTDHEHAARHAAAAAEVAPDHVDVAQVQTNIVYLERVPAAALVAARRDAGVLVTAMDASTVRLVTHVDVSTADCDRAADHLRRVLDATDLTAA
jgi:threonine aldolase